jgi:hypothetical protein
MIRRCPMKGKYVWQFSVDKATEGGIGTATAKSVLKGRTKDGIRVITYPSCYVGQTILRVEMATERARDEALKTLLDYGYIDSIEEGLRDIERIGGAV